MKDLRVSDKSPGGEILELAVVMKAKECPFIVQFYGCLVRDVSVPCASTYTCTSSLFLTLSIFLCVYVGLFVVFRVFA